MRQTRGKLEAECSRLMIQVEREHLGRDHEARTYIFRRNLRTFGVLTRAEQHLAHDQEGPG